MCDGTRRRRTRDEARRAWYARYRQFRFALHLGFLAPHAGAVRTVTPSSGLGNRLTTSIR